MNDAEDPLRFLKEVYRAERETASIVRAAAETRAGDAGARGL